MEGLQKLLNLNLVLILTMGTVSCALQSCEKVSEYISDCSYYKLSSASTWCEIDNYSISNFTFYVRPADDFEELELSLQEGDASQQVSIDETKNIRLGAELFSNQVWYKTHVKVGNQDQSQQGTFSLYINDVFMARKSLSFSQTNVFTLKLKGSLVYSAGCKPEGTVAKSDIRKFPQSEVTGKTAKGNSWVQTSIAVIGCAVFVVFVIGISWLNKRCKEKGRLFDEYEEYDKETPNTSEQC